jgi:hypothetical protein
MWHSIMLSTLAAVALILTAIRTRSDLDQELNDFEDGLDV